MHRQRRVSVGRKSDGASEPTQPVDNASHSASEAFGPGGLPAARVSNAQPIVLACDGTYAMQLATTLRSITDAHPSGLPLDIHVLVDDFSVDARMKVQDSLPSGTASIRWSTVDLASFQGFSSAPHLSSKIIFARLLLPWLFSDDVRRILYLDADLLVLDDVRPIWDLDLDGAVLGGVLDTLDLAIKQGTPGLEGVPAVTDYFNAGVLLIDLPRWRQERVSERAYAYLKEHPQSPFGDQDALNFACDGLWKKLDPRWNFQDHHETRIADMIPTERPAIVHFVTGQKPWLPSSLSVNAGLYDAFRSHTLFARTHRDRFSDTALAAWRRIKRRVRQILDIGVGKRHRESTG